MNVLYTLAKALVDFASENALATISGITGGVLPV